MKFKIYKTKNSHKHNQRIKDVENKHFQSNFSEISEKFKWKNLKLKSFKKWKMLSDTNKESQLKCSCKECLKK
jgi:hypothetical protein